LKHQLPQVMNVVYAGAYTAEMFKGFENAYKKRVLPLKEQQRRPQPRSSSSGSFALHIGGVTHEVRAASQLPQLAPHARSGPRRPPRSSAGSH
jgi:hypothetical protein